MDAFFSDSGAKAGLNRPVRAARKTPPVYQVAKAVDEARKAKRKTVGMHPRAAGIVKAFQKAGLIRSREISRGDGSGIHFELFLRSENRDFLPSHKLIRIAGQVKEVNAEGREEVVLGYPWYFFVDPMEHLKVYGIVKYMRFVPQKKVQGGSDKPQ